MTDFGLPDARLYLAIGERNGDEDLLALLVACQRNRQIIGLMRIKMRALLAILIDGLDEITLAIHEADGNEGQSQITDRFEVIASQDAQAAGIQRQALMQPIFCTKVSDYILARIDALTQRGVQIMGLLAVTPVDREHVVKFFQEFFILGELIQPCLWHMTQENFGVVRALLPDVGGDVHEQPTYPPIPAVK
jgi:hypothetical protein